MYVFRVSLVFIATLIILSGCLYPQQERMQNQVPNEQQLNSVQMAISKYQENSGILPIKTRDADTPIFLKYPIDFSQMIPHYIQDAPGNSFENGGTFQYVLVDVEKEPQVKLVDLRTVRKIQELERRILQFRRDHDYLPVVDVVGRELLKIDYDHLDYEEEPTVNSPFHPDHRLPFLLHTNGSVVIDYSLAIQDYLDEHGWGDYKEGDDLRWLLVDHSPFVPVYSIPQTFDEDKIHFIDQ